MAKELEPESVLKSLEKGQLAPFYLFYGPGEFRLEKILDKIRETFIPEVARDLNLEIVYGGESNSGEIVNRAQSLPFLARNRLIIVRRTENFKANDLETFLRYLEKPCDSTCLIFIAAGADFRKKFYKKIQSLGRAVNFKPLRENQVMPWIKRMAGEIGLTIDGQACVTLQQVVGNNLRDLHEELEKLRIRHGEIQVGVDDVKEMVIHSRVYTIFELMNMVSVKKPAEALGVLNRFLEEEDKKRAPLQIIGMLNRQIRLLWQTKAILDKGGKTKDVTKKLNLPPFSATSFVKQSRHWSAAELEKGLDLLYQADGLLKSGSRTKPVLENIIVSLCG